MTGVVELIDNIYVVVYRSNKVKVFGRPPWYDRLDDIVVKEMKYPRDLTADQTTDHLYIAEVDKLSIDEGDPRVSFIRHWSLSVAEIVEILLVSYGNLSIWSGQGDRSDVIILENKTLSNTQHVIQSSPETYLVVHEDLSPTGSGKS